MARVRRVDEFFIAECHAQVYAGDTALHGAAFADDSTTAHRLVALGSHVHAENRRGARPLHAATIGTPGSSNWNPTAQAEMINYLVSVGADPNAQAKGGVTPLHRAIRNRCSAAVAALLEAGSDVTLRNDSGSTPLELARWTTGRSGSGSAEARAEQPIIAELVQRALR